MKVLFAVVAVLAVAAPAALAAPSGLWGGHLGGVVLAAGPTTVSRTSLVQTHPSPAVVVAAPAVHPHVVAAAPIVTAPLLQRTIVAGPGLVTVDGLGLGLGHGW